MSIINKIKFHLNRLCGSCSGTGQVIRGYTPVVYGPCGSCGGSGNIN